MFRIQIGNGFSVLLGDSLDGVIQTSIMQHWYNVVRGLERWDTTAYFYPYRDTLGYNEGFFLHGALLSLFRAFGADPFLGSELASVVIRAAGFFAFELFAADVLGFGLGWALLGATLFTLSNNMFSQSSHAQLFTVSFVPLLAWLLWRGLQALRSQSTLESAGWGWAAAALYGAWLMSGFYMAWFMLLFMTLVVLAAAGQEAIGRGLGWPAWRAVATWRLVPIALALAVACLPFLLVYVPKARETGSHPFSSAMAYAPTPLDLLHVGSMNLIFGGLDRWLTSVTRPGFPDYGEQTIGFAPGLVILAIAGAVLALCVRPRPLLMRSIALATLVSFALVVRFGNHTLWYLIYAFFPGGSAVRVVARYPLFLTFPMVLLAVSFLRFAAGRWPVWLVACIGVLLIAEEITAYDPTDLDRRSELAALNVPPPPPWCRAFFVRNGANRTVFSDPIINAFYPHNVDAMMLAEMIALPTINGFATFNPPDWNFASVTEPDYLPRVRQYLVAHELDNGICGLDLARQVWTPALDLAVQRLALGVPVDLGKGKGDAEAYLSGGWAAADESGRWGAGRWVNKREARLSFLAPAMPAASDLLLRIAAASFVRAGRTPTPVAVEVNGEQVTTWHPQDGEQTLATVIPRRLIGENRLVRIRLMAAAPHVAWPFWQHKDAQRIGLFARSLEILTDAAD